MNKKVSYITVALSYVGAFVGAGFISGQELVQFFIRFGVWGLVGWVATGLTITLGGGMILGMLASKKPESFDELVKSYFGKEVTGIVNFIINGYLVGGLIIMLSGAGSLVAEISYSPLWLSVIFVSCLILLAIIGKGERLLKVNRMLVPILIFTTVIVTVNMLAANKWILDIDSQFVIKNPSPMLINPVVSYLLYIGYNAIGAIVALVNISKQVDSKTGRNGGFLGGGIITVLGGLLLAAVWISYPEWSQADLPITHILKKNYGVVYLFFVPTILIAMYTVATAYALGISKYIENKFRAKFLWVCVGLVATITPVAFLGFSRLLGLIYPFFGIMATLILIYLLVDLLVKKISKKYVFQQNR